MKGFLFLKIKNTVTDTVKDLQVHKFQCLRVLLPRHFVVQIWQQSLNFPGGLLILPALTVSTNAVICDGVNLS